MRQVASESVRWKAAIKIFIYVFAFVGFLFPKSEAKKPSERQVPRLKGYLGSPYGYWEYLPPNYEKTSNHPVVIYLHGIKNIGHGNSEEELRTVLTGGPPLLVNEKEQDFPFVLISPQSSGVEEAFAAQRLERFIDILLANYKIDPGRVYVTGLSFGGFATWNIAVMAGKKIAAIVPICSCAPPDVSSLKDIPVWAFVNSGDYEVPGCMYDALEQIRNAGGNPMFTIYEKKGHNAWGLTYDDPQMWAWLLSQRKSATIENRNPFLVDPGDHPVAIGYPQSFQVLASDPDNDQMQFILEEPLPDGIKFSVEKNGLATFHINTNIPGAYPIKITVKDGKGGSMTQNFVLSVQYSPLLIFIIVLFILQPFLLAMDWVRNQIIRIIQIIIQAANLLRRVIVWLETVAVKNNIL